MELEPALLFDEGGPRLVRGRCSATLSWFRLGRGAALQQYSTYWKRHQLRRSLAVIMEDTINNAECVKMVSTDSVDNDTWEAVHMEASYLVLVGQTP